MVLFKTCSYPLSILLFWEHAIWEFISLFPGNIHGHLTSPFLENIVNLWLWLLTWYMRYIGVLNFSATTKLWLKRWPRTGRCWPTPTWWSRGRNSSPSGGRTRSSDRTWWSSTLTPPTSSTPWQQRKEETWKRKWPGQPEVQDAPLGGFCRVDLYRRLC